MSSNEQGQVRVERGAKRVRGFLDGQLVLETTSPLFVWEIPYYPVYYFPVADLTAELVPTGEVTASIERGDGHHHDIHVGDLVAKGAAVTYPDSSVAELRDRVRIEWSTLSAWFEEDEEVFTHPRSPYTRVDILPTSRHLKALIGDTVLAETTSGHALFETGLPPRWYFPKLDVRMDLLAPSDTVTACPYKGRAAHLSARIDGVETTDVAWTYRTPLPESERIAGLISFYDNRVTVLVDGEPTV